MGHQHVSFQSDHPPALDLMYQMIRYEPEERITAAEALEHPWLAAFHDPEEDLLAPQPQNFTRWKDIEALETVEEFRDAIWNEIHVRAYCDSKGCIIETDFGLRQEYRTQARSLAECSASPVATFHHSASSVRQSIPEEPEPEVPAVEASDPTSYFPSAKSHPESQPETLLHPPPISVIQDDTDAVPAAVPRPRKISQHPDPYATFNRRSSAIFGASYSPAASSVGLTPSNASSSFAQFPVLDENDDSTPSAVAIPVRSRLPSMIDGGQYRHLRTLSTVSIHENGARPGGLAAIAPIGKYVGATKTAGADAPPSSPPTDLRKD
jgi:mitogen-activated protein kinase 7